MKNLLVMGNGLLGGNIINNSNKKDYRKFSTYYNDPKELPGKEFQLDVRNAGKMKKIISQISPDVLVYTSAYHDVDGCEENTKKSHKVNVEGVENAIKFSKEELDKFIYISTDYVFEGEKGSAPYTEDDEPHPQSAYAEHKLEAENYVLSHNNFLVVRPSVIYGWDPIKDNFVTWAIEELRSRNELNIVNDQLSNPTYAPDLAKIILELIRKNENGLFHTTGSACLDRYNFTKKVAEVFDLDKLLIKSITTEELGQTAQRPKHCCTNTQKLEAVIERKPLSPEEGLAKMKEKEVNN